MSLRSSASGRQGENEAVIASAAKQSAWFQSDVGAYRNTPLHRKKNPSPRPLPQGEREYLQRAGINPAPTYVRWQEGQKNELRSPARRRLVLPHPAGPGSP